MWVIYKKQDNKQYFWRGTEWSEELNEYTTLFKDRDKGEDIANKVRTSEGVLGGIKHKMIRCISLHNAEQIMERKNKNKYYGIF